MIQVKSIGRNTCLYIPLRSITSSYIINLTQVIDIGFSCSNEEKNCFIFSFKNSRGTFVEKEERVYTNSQVVKEIDWYDLINLFIHDDKGLLVLGNETFLTIKEPEGDYTWFNLSYVEELTIPESITQPLVINRFNNQTISYFLMQGELDKLRSYF